MLFNGKSICNINDSIVVSIEKRNKHILINQSGSDVYKYHIDGDIVKRKDVQKCDYIVEVNTSNCLMAFVIELKGSDTKKAIEQIKSTMNIFKDELKGYKLCPRVVINKVPSHDVHSSIYREFKKQFPNFKMGTKVVEDMV